LYIFRTLATLATYVTWIAIGSKLSYMSTPFQQAILQLNTKLYGVEGDTPRWQKCTDRTDSVLGFATGALYVERYFPDTERLRVMISLTLYHSVCINALTSTVAIGVQI